MAMIIDADMTTRTRTHNLSDLFLMSRLRDIRHFGVILAVRALMDIRTTYSAECVVRERISRPTELQIFTVHHEH